MCLLPSCYEVTLTLVVTIVCNFRATSLPFCLCMSWCSCITLHTLCISSVIASAALSISWSVCWLFPMFLCRSLLGMNFLWWFSNWYRFLCFFAAFVFQGCQLQIGFLLGWFGASVHGGPWCCIAWSSFPRSSRREVSCPWSIRRRDQWVSSQGWGRRSALSASSQYLPRHGYPRPGFEWVAASLDQQGGVLLPGCGCISMLSMCFQSFLSGCARDPGRNLSAGWTSGRSQECTHQCSGSCRCCCSGAQARWSQRAGA